MEPHELETIFDPNKDLSIKSKRLIALDRQKEESSKYLFAWANDQNEIIVGPNIGKIGPGAYIDDLLSLKKEIEKIRDDHDINRATVKSVATFVDVSLTAIQLIPAVPASLPALLSVMALQRAFEETFEFASEGIEKSQKRHMERVVGELLKQTRNKYPDVESIEKLTPEQRSKIVILDNYHILESLESEEFDENTRQVLTDAMSKLMEDFLRKGVTLNNLINHDQDISIEELKHSYLQLVGICKASQGTYEALLEKTEAQGVLLNNLEQEFQSQSESLIDLKKKIEDNSDVSEEVIESFIKMAIYSSQSPEKILQMLGNDEIFNLDDDKKKALIKEVEAKINKRDNKDERDNSSGGEEYTLGDFYKHLDLTSAFIDLGRKFGIESELINEIEKVSFLAKTGIAAFAAFTATDYVGAVNLFSSFVGAFSSPKDISAIRHEQIVNMLTKLGLKQDKIIENQKVINHKLENVLKGQSVIYDTIRQTSEIIISAWDDINSKLFEINHSVKVTQSISLAILNENVDKLRQFLETRERYRIIEYEANRLSLKGMREHFEIPICYDNFRDGWQAVEAVIFEDDSISIDDSINDIFHCAAYPNEVSLEWLEKHKLLIRNFFGKQVEAMTTSGGKMSLDVISMIILYPSKTVLDIDNKLNRITSFQENDLSAFNFKSLGTLVFPRKVEAVGRWLLDTYYYWDFIGRKVDWFFSPTDEVLERSSSNKFHPGKEVLIKYLSIINLAIAQQATLSGDFCLHSISRFIIAEQHSKNDRGSENFLNILDIFRTNGFLKENWIMYLIHSAIRDSEKTFFYYHMALSALSYGEKHSYLMNDLLGKAHGFSTKFKFSVSEDQVDLVLEGHDEHSNNEPVYITLPSSEKVRKGEMIYHPDLLLLLRLKEDVFWALEEYTLGKKMSEDAYKLLTDLVSKS